MKAHPPLLFVAAACVAAIACETRKTENPLSPSIAGAIAGVSISAPRALEPASGTKVLVQAQPVSLVIENATTSGQRPMTYSYQVSTDPAFPSSAVVFARDGVPPGAQGRTAVGVGTSLTAGRTYHWRARALDGANSGPFTDPIHFLVVEPVVLHLPGPVSPIEGARVASQQPTLRVTNASRTGPAGAITYDFQVSDSNQFGSIVASGFSNEQPGATEFVVGSVLELNRTYYWRSRAVDPTAQGSWTGAQAFLTPLPAPAPAPAPTPLPPGAPPPPSGRGIPNVAEGVAMVQFVMNDLRRRGISTAGDCGAWEITRRVAWNFRDRDAGLEYKPGGRNCNANSIDIVFFIGGMSADILVGAGVDNGPSWQLHDPVPEWRETWRAPTDPDGFLLLARRLLLGPRRTGGN